MSGSFLRWIYRGGRPNRTGRVMNRFSAWLYSIGVWPNRLVTLEVVGRRSGRVIAFPLVMVSDRDRRFLVAMLGPSTNWVRNLEAAGRSAVLRHGRREQVTLVDVPVPERPPILQRYLDIAPGARPHMPVRRGDPPERFLEVSASIPVYEITSTRPDPAPGIR